MKSRNLLSRCATGIWCESVCATSSRLALSLMRKTLTNPEEEPKNRAARAFGRFNGTLGTWRAVSERFQSPERNRSVIASQLRETKEDQYAEGYLIAKQKWLRPPRRRWSCLSRRRARPRPSWRHRQPTRGLRRSRAQRPRRRGSTCGWRAPGAAQTEGTFARHVRGADVGA